VVLEQRHKLCCERCLERLAADHGILGDHTDCRRLRAEEGTDFAEDVADDAKAGTLHNMLSAAVLDAVQFPDTTIRSVAVTSKNGSLAATLKVSIAGHESMLVVPFTVDISPGRLTARGALTLRQSALGLTPLSIFLGALRVQDEMRIRF
jgi:polyisoprenoid-binding protein YceI